MKQKNFGVAKNIFLSMKKQPTEWETYLLATSVTQNYCLESKKQLRNTNIKEKTFK